MLRLEPILCYWLLLLYCNLLTISAQSPQTDGNHSSFTLTTTTLQATPAPTIQSTPSIVMATTSSTLDSDHSSDCGMYITVAAVLGALLFISILLLICVFTCFLCTICSRRNEKEFEIKQYVFEEGVEQPKLWVDPNAVEEKPSEHQPDIWEVSTFSPSPKSKDTTMPMPEVETSNTNGTTHPVPVQQPVVLVQRRKQSSHFRPKRVAPPPPKGGKRRKRFGRRTEETVVYAVPANYIVPVSQKRTGYDVPKSHKPHVYKSIDTTRIKPPNPYAGLVIQPDN